MTCVTLPFLFSFSAWLFGRLRNKYYLCNRKQSIENRKTDVQKVPNHYILRMFSMHAIPILRMFERRRASSGFRNGTPRIRCFKPFSGWLDVCRISKRILDSRRFFLYCIAEHDCFAPGGIRSHTFWTRTEGRWKKIQIRWWSCSSAQYPSRR